MTDYELLLFTERGQICLQIKPMMRFAIRLTPDEARELANALLKAASDTDGLRPARGSAAAGVN
jgi:hypothetical protein